MHKAITHRKRKLPTAEEISMMVLSPSATSRWSPSSLGKPEPELASDELGKGDVVTTEVDDFVEWLVDRGCSNVDMKGNVDDCVVGIVDS